MLKLSVLLICAFVVSQSDAWSVNPNWAKWLTVPVWRSKVSDVSVPLERSECVFFRNENVLGCVGVNRAVVECPAVLNVTGLDQNMFGSFIVGFDSTESIDSIVKLHLYPNLVDYSQYMVSKLSLAGLPVEFCLHDSVDLPVFGVRVTNSSCFARLLTNLRSGNTNELYTLSSFEVVKPKVVQLSTLYVV